MFWKIFCILRNLYSLMMKRNCEGFFVFISQFIFKPVLHTLNRSRSMVLHKSWKYAMSRLCLKSSVHGLIFAETYWSVKCSFICILSFDYGRMGQSTYLSVVLTLDCITVWCPCCVVDSQVIDFDPCGNCKM